LFLKKSDDESDSDLLNDTYEPRLEVNDHQTTTRFLGDLLSNAPSTRTTDSEKLLLALLRWKDKHNIANNSFSSLLDILRSHCQLDLPIEESNSFYKAEKIAQQLLPFKPTTYDCCVNGHMCFTGEHSDLTQCKYCNEERFDSTEKA